MKIISYTPEAQRRRRPAAAPIPRETATRSIAAGPPEDETRPKPSSTLYPSPPNPFQLHAPSLRQTKSTKSLFGKPSDGSFSGDVFEAIKLPNLDPPTPEEPSAPWCAVCYSVWTPEDSMVILPGCKHPFCRECLVGHVHAKIEEGQFPIVCPSCAIDHSLPSRLKTEIDQTTILALGEVFTDKELDKFEDLQLAEHAMSMECPGCKSSMRLARDDLDGTYLLQCPLPECHAKWCRRCHQVISSCTRSHRCSSDRSFRWLMWKRKFRYCPGCRAPTEKVDGCDHMTCAARGCGTHFCWRCGNSIWRPGQRGSSYDAVRAHNRWCRVVFCFGGCRIQ